MRSPDPDGPEPLTTWMASGGALTRRWSMAPDLAPSALPASGRPRPNDPAGGGHLELDGTRRAESRPVECAFRAQHGAHGVRLVPRAMVFAVVLCLFVPLDVAQAGKGSAEGSGVRSGPGGASGAGPGPRRGTRAEDLRETLTILMMVRMKSELGLSKTQYEQLLPKIEESERARASAFQSRRETDQRIRTLLAQSAASESDLLQIVEKRIALEEAEHRREQALVQDVRGILTPRQQAQFVLFRQRFRAWLEQRLRDMREVRAGGGRPGARAGRGRPGSAEPDVDAEGDEWDETPAEPRPDRMPEDRPPK